MSSSINDAYYSFDETEIEKIRNAKGWMSDPKYFKRVKISPSATIKMMMHGQSGVDKGVKKGGKPIEVMGLLLGRPDLEDPNCLIISDAQALPIEGFETKVVADDENVINYMIALSESNEISRKERFCGWYHTHPFDVDVNSHCYLSSTDISTQLSWQRQEDPHGNPWLAIVIDPLRSLAKGRPELMAFRVYPPDYNPPLNETPDGTFVTEDRLRVEKWGVAWNRYYRLDSSYYISNLAQNVLGILKDNFLWQNSFTTTPMLEPDNQKSMAERIDVVSNKLNINENSNKSSELFMKTSKSNKDELSGMQKISLSGSELASECCQGCISQHIKKIVFATSLANRRKESANKIAQSSNGNDTNP